MGFQSMFNILFCYFPITFRPPPNDKYGITTADLRMALRCVILSCFEFLLYQFLEKEMPWGNSNLWSSGNLCISGKNNSWVSCHQGTINCNISMLRKLS